MPPLLDLDAYFGRIAWGGSTARTYDTVAGLLRAHMQAIPFENLDVLLGQPVRLDIEGLQAKLVRTRRGGYCFEHAMLFAAVLDALGFAPVRHTARVIMLLARDIAPRSHMCMTIELPEGRFVLDPGFGRGAPRVPVPLADNVRVTVDNEVHWMARDEGAWILRTERESGSPDCWISTFERDNPVDFEMGSFYVSRHPESAFVNRLLLRALTRNGHVAVMNREVTIREGTRSRTLELEHRRELRDLLGEHFGFDLPEVERMRVPAIPEWN